MRIMITTEIEFDLPRPMTQSQMRGLLRAVRHAVGTIPGVSAVYRSTGTALDPHDYPEGMAMIWDTGLPPVIYGEDFSSVLLTPDPELERLLAEEQEIERRTPHSFRGRVDRWCERCNLPDRNPIHLYAPPTNTTEETVHPPVSELGTGEVL